MIALFFASEGVASITTRFQAFIMEAAIAIVNIAKDMKDLNPSWVIAAFAFMQWLIARNNLRLGLYNRRFEVYSSFLSLKIWLDRYDGSDKSEKDKESVISSYLQSLRASRFLFNPCDNIQSLLGEAWEIYFREYSWRRRCNSTKASGGQSLSTAYYEMLAKEQRVHEVDSARLEQIAMIIEEVLEGYLGFGHIDRRWLPFFLR